MHRAPRAEHAEHFAQDDELRPRRSCVGGAGGVVEASEGGATVTVTEGRRVTPVPAGHGHGSLTSQRIDGPRKGRVRRTDSSTKPCNSATPSSARDHAAMGRNLGSWASDTTLAWQVGLQINNEFKRETNTQQCAANRKKNACAAVVPNPCSTKFNGVGGKASLRNVRLSCDEFPFASTDVATAMTNNNLIATRCVDAKHNSRQGGKIGGFYRYVLGAGESFEVKFDYGNGAQGPNDGPAGSTTMGYCKTGVAKGSGQTCDKDDMQMN
ncbi:hypothetical protein B0H13DRAFT_2540419 [Mycena leptocephala]|nr:hypothetical protein B0H13DRAFT_2540419 [Mycena leptocephala]